VELTSADQLNQNVYIDYLSILFKPFNFFLIKSSFFNHRFQLNFIKYIKINKM